MPTKKRPPHWQPGWKSVGPVGEPERKPLNDLMPEPRTPDEMAAYVKQFDVDKPRLERWVLDSAKPRKKPGKRGRPGKINPALRVLDQIPRWRDMTGEELAKKLGELGHPMDARRARELKRAVLSTD